jgi:hypothetical protein
VIISLKGYPRRNAFQLHKRVRITIDIRKIAVRGSERILLDITDLTAIRTVSLPPMPVDSAFDNLQFIVLDMLEQNRDSGAHSIVKNPDETPTALIPRDRPPTEGTGPVNR